MLQGNRPLMCEFLHGNVWKLGWEADENYHWLGSLILCPEHHFLKIKTKFPSILPVRKGRKTEQRSYTKLAGMDLQSSFCEGCVLRDKRQDTMLAGCSPSNTAESAKCPSIPTQAIFVGELQSSWYLNGNAIKACQHSQKSKQVSRILVGFTLFSLRGREKK